MAGEDLDAPAGGGGHLHPDRRVHAAVQGPARHSRLSGPVCQVHTYIQAITSGKNAFHKKNLVTNPYLLDF